MSRIDINKPKLVETAAMATFDVEVPAIAIGVPGSSESAQGPQGASGLLGPQGPAGSGLNISGYAPEVKHLPLSTRPNSIWMVDDELYVFVGYNCGEECTPNWAWKNLGPISKPGPQGVQGIPGPKGDPFRIAYRYKSIEVMTSDFNNPEVNVGDFVIINTGEKSNEDNGKVYLKGELEWEFVVDLNARDVVGVDGKDGAQGVQGSQGLQGVQGSQGISGLDGVQGAIGPQGLQGLQGEVGIQGSTGVQGSTGSQGIQGETGLQGLQGLQGIQGPIGTGVPGPQGSVGKGDPGPQGSAGRDGVQGSTGIQGPQGSDGQSGVQGIQGLQGSQGSQGSPGSDGVQGSTGSQGATGDGIGSISGLRLGDGIDSFKDSIDWTKIALGEDGLLFRTGSSEDKSTSTTDKKVLPIFGQNLSSIKIPKDQFTSPYSIKGLYDYPPLVRGFMNGSEVEFEFKYDESSKTVTLEFNQSNITSDMVIYVYQ